jgi:hypothetical protein
MLTAYDQGMLQALLAQAPLAHMRLRTGAKYSATSAAFLAYTSRVHASSGHMACHRDP